ncbi:MAG: hypothetical protein ABGW87_12190 [Sphingomonadaceae bacterium]
MNILPVLGASLAILFLGEPLHTFHAVGLILILGGIMFAGRGQQARSGKFSRQLGPVQAAGSETAALRVGLADRRQSAPGPQGATIAGVNERPVSKIKLGVEIVGFVGESGHAAKSDFCTP